jgi:hypothetical protein
MQPTNESQHAYKEWLQGAAHRFGNFDVGARFLEKCESRAFANIREAWQVYCSPRTRHSADEVLFAVRLLFWQ